MRSLLSLLALLITPVAVQNGSLHGITVNGSATKSIPATRARISLTFFTRSGAATLNTTTLQPIVDALVKTGVSREDITLPEVLGSSANVNNATVTAIVANPTVAEMQSGIATVGAAIAASNGLNLGNAQVFLDAEHCGDTVDAVRAIAIKNARGKAEETARDLQVHVGPVLNIVANDQLNASDTCSSQYYVGQGPSALTSASDYVSVPVVVNVTITYAIKN